MRSMQWQLGMLETDSAFAYRHRETEKNLFRGGRSQDLPNFTCKGNMKLVTNKFKLGGLHEKHVVATWNVGNRLSICLQTQGNRLQGTVKP